MNRQFTRARLGFTLRRDRTELDCANKQELSPGLQKSIRIIFIRCFPFRYGRSEGDNDHIPFIQPVRIGKAVTGLDRID